MAQSGNQFKGLKTMTTKLSRHQTVMYVNIKIQYITKKQFRMFPLSDINGCATEQAESTTCTGIVFLVPECFF
jgi:hypothetical protein